MIAETKDLKKIIIHYGAYNQISKTVEELIELSEVLIKDVNKSEFDKERLYEELADVWVMLAQLKIIYNINYDELQMIIDQKIKRTLDRIDKEPSGVYYDGKGNLLGIDTDCSWK